MKHKILDKIIAGLNSKQEYTTAQLLQVISTCIPDAQPSTHYWWINRLVSKEVIYKRGRGYYSFHKKDVFKPVLSKKAKQIYNSIKTTIKTDNIIVFETAMVNQFIPKEIARAFIYFMIPRDQLQDVFYFLINKYKDVYLNPNATIVKQYVLFKPEAIILIPLIKQTPVMELKGYHCPSVEGLIINTWLFNETYAKPAKISLFNFFNQIFSSYAVNVPQLLRYAARRRIRDDIEKYLVKNGWWK